MPMPNKKPQAWEIWLTYLYFEDKPSIGKIRPILILECTEKYSLVAKITTHKPRQTTSDYPLVDWARAGLDRPSTIRCVPLFEVSIIELLRDQALGVLGAADREQIVAIMKSLGVMRPGY